MKKSISLVLCLAMLISVFSCLGVTASAAGDPKELFTVKASGFKNNKITYTVYLNKGVNMLGAIIYAKFDSDVLAIDEENTGAYMKVDEFGDEYQSINGEYVKDFMVGHDDQYSIAHVFGTESDYKAGSSNKPYMQFTFKAIDNDRPKTTVKFYCYEFNSQSIPENNIPNGNDETVANANIDRFIFSDTRTTLGKAVISSVSSVEDGVKIKWDKVTGADFYRVYRIEDGKANLIKSTADGDEVTYVDKNVKNNKTYTYAVRAVNEASFADEDGNKYGAELSDSVSTRYTVAPAKLSVSNDDGKVIVKWSEVEGATSYRVYRREVDADGDVTAWEYVSKKITACNYSDTTAKSGTKYQYAVRVYSKGGNSDLYSEKETVYLSLPDFSVKATVKGVKITWDKVAGAESYRVYRKVGSGS